DEVATGEVWFGKRALDAKLVDDLMTSDEYLSELAAESDVYLIRYEQKQTLKDKVASMTTESGDKLLLRWVKRLQDSRNIQF
ncbi:MAG: S49 family peptidase, partial [Pontibacterium sp.]